MSRPSTSQLREMNGHKRSRDISSEDPSKSTIVPMSDKNSWYYPAYGYDSDEDETPLHPHRGNWGKKDLRGARWVRRGKITAWGPTMDDWEAEERARKRVKLLMPQPRRSPSPPTLPHLAAPSSPLMSPYPRPITQHFSYASFVMDKAVTHSFRSRLPDELEHSTNSLIEAEAAMRRALGRLWQVISENPDQQRQDASLVATKREEVDDGPGGEQDERAKRIARAPDLTPAIHKLFLFSPQNGNGPTMFEPSHFSSPETQLDNLEKAMAVLHELHDDGREYVERLHEIREGLGEIRAHRNGIWDMVRERAIKELQDMALSTTM
ncbi:hypothetical protein C8J56DRAFT_818262 [Mycena floridula]|nr:hypothetical protein C8J56DRAFT_818262 [Mycena floridula]